MQDDLGISVKDSPAIQETLKSLFVRIKLCLAKGEQYAEMLTVPTLGPDAYLKSIDLFMKSADAYKGEIKKYEDTIKEYKVGSLGLLCFPLSQLPAK